LKSKGIANKIDIVLDNAGFEFLTDLVLATYLVQAGYTKKITLHGKRIGWFVSDVMVPDLEDLLVTLERGDGFGATEEQDKKNFQKVGKI
jgi:hypothetical protein